MLAQEGLLMPHLGSAGHRLAVCHPRSHLATWIMGLLGTGVAGGGVVGSVGEKAQPKVVAHTWGLWANCVAVHCLAGLGTVRIKQCGACNVPIYTSHHRWFHGVCVAVGPFQNVHWVVGCGWLTGVVTTARHWQGWWVGGGRQVVWVGRSHQRRGWPAHLSWHQPGHPGGGHLHCGAFHPWSHTPPPHPHLGECQSCLHTWAGMLPWFMLFGQGLACSHQHTMLLGGITPSILATRLEASHGHHHLSPPGHLVAFAAGLWGKGWGWLWNGHHPPGATV